MYNVQHAKKYKDTYKYNNIKEILRTPYNKCRHICRKCNSYAVRKCDNTMIKCYAIYHWGNTQLCQCTHTGQYFIHIETVYLISLLGGYYGIGCAGRESGRGGGALSHERELHDIHRLTSLFQILSVGFAFIEYLHSCFHICLSCWHTHQARWLACLYVCLYFRLH